VTRHDRSASVGVALALACAPGALACGKGGGSCDERSLTAGLDALAQLKSDTSAVAAAVIAEGCPSGMPAGLRRALGDHAQMGGHGGFAALGRGLAESLAEAPSLWERACGASVREIVDGIQTFVAAGHGQGAFISMCDATRGGLVTAGEIERADPGTLLLATITHAWLATEGTTPARAKALARALADLPR